MRLFGVPASSRLRRGVSNEPMALPVVALWNFEGGDPAYLTDKSANAFVLTQNGSFGRSVGGGVFSSDGAGRLGTSTASRGTTAHNAAFIFSGAFTIEGWLKRPGSTAVAGVAAKWQNVADGRSWALRTSGSSLFPVGELSVNGSSAGLTLTSSIAMSDATDFHHIALERNDSDVVRLYLDGVIVDSGSLSGALFNNSSIPVEISGYNAGNVGTGTRIDEVRITAAAVYDGAFTPPAGPFPIP